MQGNTELASRRKRKDRLVAAREPNGRIQRQSEFPPTQVKRLRDAALSGMRDPEWGTELGRLFLNNTITPAMYAAGKRWREWAETYQRAIGVFPVRSVNAERGHGGSPVDPDSPVGKIIAQREADAAERFFAAQAALVSAGVESPVRKCCEDNQMPGDFGELMALRKGLLTLVSHWDLTGVGKSWQPVR